ncbi:MAG: thioredoxin fold domain-containing protein [Bacteroidetes bacterium]|nr:thioredoxin fold domain-containing protein [Bacteroidota bacterium]
MSILFGILFSVGSLFYQVPDSSIQWFTDIEVAKIQAKANKQKILMVFAGSDWCRPCMKFKQDILLSPAFDEFASDKIVVLYLDFPAKKKNKLSDKQIQHNEALAEKYNRSGVFPMLVLMNSDEEVLGKPVFSNQTPESFTGELKAIIENKS